MKILRIILFLFLSILVVSCTSSKPKLELANPFEEGKVGNLKYAIEKVKNKEKRYVIQGEEVGFFTACDDDNAKSRLKNIANNTCIDLHGSNLLAKDIAFREDEGGSCSKISLWFYCDFTEQQKIEIKKKKEKEIAKKVAEELAKIKELHGERVNDLQEMYYNECNEERYKLEKYNNKGSYLDYKQCLENLNYDTVNRFSKMNKNFNSLQENKLETIPTECNGWQQKIFNLPNPEYIDCMELKYLVLKEEDLKLMEIKKQKKQKKEIELIQVSLPDSIEICGQPEVENKYRCYDDINNKEKNIARLEEKYSCFLNYFFGDRYTTYYNCLNDQEIKEEKKITKKKKKKEYEKNLKEWNKNKNEKKITSSVSPINCSVNSKSWFCKLLTKDKKNANKLINIYNTKKENKITEQNPSIDQEYNNKRIAIEEAKLNEIIKQRKIAEKQTEIANTQAEIAKKDLEEQQKIAAETKRQRQIEQQRDSIRTMRCGALIFMGGSIWDC